MLIALAAMLMQQTLASVGRVLPAMLAPLVIAELHVDPGWVGLYYGVSAAASLVARWVAAALSSATARSG
jgi:hypothetical protein